MRQLFHPNTHWWQSRASFQPIPHRLTPLCSLPCHVPIHQWWLYSYHCHSRKALLQRLRLSLGPNPLTPPPPAANTSSKWHNPLDSSLLHSYPSPSQLLPLSSATPPPLGSSSRSATTTSLYRGFLYMSKVNLAITLLDYFLALMRSTIGESGSGSGSDSARRYVLLRRMKVKGEEAVRMRNVDSMVHDSKESVVEVVVR